MIIGELPLVVAEERHDVGHLVDLLVHLHQPEISRSTVFSDLDLGLT